MPWYTESENRKAGEEVLSTTTDARRSSNQLQITSIIFICMPLCSSLIRNREVETRSNAPETSEQYNATR